MNRAPKKAIKPDSNTVTSAGSLLAFPARWLSLLASVFVLAGCISSPSNWQSNLPAAKISHWEASGKLGFVHENQAKTMNFQWKNRARKFDIRLFGLLGLGSAKLEGDARKVTLKTKHGTYHSTSADRLIEETLNMSVPVEDLVFWIKGIPSPNSPVSAQTLHPDGSLATLTQRGWVLSYPSYFRDRTPALPNKIIAKREGLKLTIAIKSWQLH